MRFWSLDEEVIPNFAFMLQAVLASAPNSILNSSGAVVLLPQQYNKATRTPNRTSSSLHCSYRSTDGRATGGHEI